jgi:hypothetical protein
MHKRVGKKRGGYPKGQNRKVRSRKGMKNTKIISAMRGK